METILANRTSPSLRRTTWLGRDYYVVPMSLIVPGVLNGSQGPLYYPPEEIARNVSDWNGMPLVVYHPVRNGLPTSAKDPDILEKQGVGNLYRVRVDRRGRLTGEGWFDIERTRQVDNRIIESLEAGRPVELSTGLFTRNEPVPASPPSVYNGRVYTHIARDYKPDHIAILPDQVGACSLNDGCGALVNVKAELVANFGGGLGFYYVPGITLNDSSCSCGGKCEECKKKARRMPTMAALRKAKGMTANTEGWETIENKKKKQPSAGLDMTPDKACQILKDGTAQGHPLTEKQRGMFGALCGKSKKKSTMNSQANEAWVSLRNSFCPTGKGGGIDPTCSPGSLKSHRFKDVAEIKSFVKGLAEKDPAKIVHHLVNDFGEEEKYIPTSSLGRQNMLEQALRGVHSKQTGEGMAYKPIEENAPKRSRINWKG